MKSVVSEKDLKSLLTSTLRRQHFLGAQPGAQRLIPLAAFAVGDYVANKTGNINKVEDLLCDPKSNSEDQGILLSAPSEQKTMTNLYSGVGMSSTVETCLVCARAQAGNAHGYHILSSAVQLRNKHFGLSGLDGNGMEQRAEKQSP